jgi:hypothetical protein
MSTKSWILKFPLNDAGESEGLGDAGIETFRDSPYASTARECGQNTKDAAAGVPVTLRFDVLDEPLSTIPCIEELAKHVELCLAAAESKKDEKEIEFFRQAQKSLQGPNVSVLRIADFNTKGLAGPCVDGKPFHSLLKAAGVSVKESSTSGGSFGIGKNAAFAVSDLQTVFYSTVYLDEHTHKPEFLAQGKSKLVSHISSDGIPLRQTGYWGNPDGFLPVSDAGGIPPWLYRSEIGTSVYAIGFREVEHWEHRITYSILQNFFPAIYRGDMIFEINNSKIKIDRLGLDALFQSQPVSQAADADGHSEDFALSQAFLECLQSGDAVEVSVTIKSLGKISVRVLVKEGLPKRVAIVRNGMLITTDLQNFNEKFLRFPGCRDFVAVVEPLENEGSALLKRLENPRHNELSAARISDKTKRDQATRAMKELQKQIREAIKSQAAVSQADAISLDELGKFFAAGKPSQKTKDPAANESFNGVIVYEPKEVKAKAKKKHSAWKQIETGPQSGNELAEDNGGAGTGHGQENDDGAGHGAGAGGLGGATGNAKSTGKQKSGIPVELLEVRNTIPEENNMRLRKILFTPEESGRLRVELRAAGIADSVKINAQKASEASVKDGRIFLEGKQGCRSTILVEFSEPYDGPLELSAETATAENGEASV